MARDRKISRDYADRHPRPVEKIQLSDKSPKWRLVLVIALIFVGVSLIAYSFVKFINKQPGWTNIQANTSEVNCGQEFVFQYYLGANGASAKADHKKIVILYSDATRKAYQIFHNNEAFAGVINIYHLNSNPNTEFVVDDLLYKAFEKIEESASRAIYLAPVYDEYFSLFNSQHDWEAIEYDPNKNPEEAAYISNLMKYIKDPDSVKIQLLGDNKVRLYVSDEYLNYAKSLGITSFIDFNWMKNAFIIDYIADIMIENGYKLGSITSFDGYTRNLDDISGEEYLYKIQDRSDNTIYPAGTMKYKNSISIVSFKNYKMSIADNYWYYEYEDGEIRHRYIDENDGYDKSSVNNIIAYSQNPAIGCADIMLELTPVYISDRFDISSINLLNNKDIETIYIDNYNIKTTDANIYIDDLYNENGISYSWQK